MSQLTLDLPESLRIALERRATLEGVTLEQYIVSSLTRFAIAPDLTCQKISFEEMMTRFPEEEADAASGIF
jgi:hypothetical protein